MPVPVWQARRQGRQAGSDPPRPRVLIADHCSSPLALADTVASVVSKTPPSPPSPPKTRERDGQESAAALIRRNGWSCRDTGPVRLHLLVLDFQRRRRGSWFMAARFTGKDRRGGGAEEGGGDETTAASAAATSRGAFTHIHGPPFPRRGGLGTLSSPCLTGRGRRSKSREKSAFRPPSSGGKRRGRVVCLQGPPPRGAHPADAKGFSLLLSRATICPLTTRGGVGRRHA